MSDVVEVDMETLTIPRVTVLTGHTSADTAYVVDDYPYGRRLRCKIRYWIDTATKGAAKGQQRFMAQTTNPKSREPGDVWNKPKASTYSQIMVMYLDDIGHVHNYGLPFWLDGPCDVRTRAMGVYDALSVDQREVYDALVKLYRKANGTCWEEWLDKVSALAEFIATTGKAPTLRNSVWVNGNRQVYLTDPAAYLIAARAAIAPQDG
jgi:hypothetical protein